MPDATSLRHYKPKTKKPADEEDIVLRHHMSNVGCTTVEQYQNWCMRVGVSQMLRKSVRERQREVVLFEQQRIRAALDAARRFERHPDEVLRALSRGEKAGLDVFRRPYLRLVASLFRASNHAPRITEAFLRLLLQTNRVADLETLSPVVERYGENDANTFAFGLLSLARLRTHWVREPETWKPTTHRPFRQFVEFAEHLLCYYPTPTFLLSAFFKNDNTSIREQQNWFVQAGTGSNLRHLYPLPFCVTKRIAHVALTQVPEHLSVEEGWRWAQVVGMGGTGQLAQTLLQTTLVQFASPQTEAFLETVIRFFVENPLISPAQIGPMVDYLRYEWETPRDAGDRSRLPAGFTLKGRAPAALIARMEAWHARLALETRTTRAGQKWEPCGLLPFVHEEHDTSGSLWRTWSIVELTHAKALTQEGAAMSHCVGTYVAMCVAGSTSIWSVRVKTPRNLEPERVMTIAVSPGKVVTEARGKRNALPSDTAKGTWGVRLSQNDAQLLNEAVPIVRRWAAFQHVRLPAFLQGPA